MTTINYEESYFKLKKSNEELTVLVNKVINDFKQTKSQLLSEKDKNSVIWKRNVSLENQVTELTSKYESQLQELEDLRDEVASMKTYTKAVEGVAENFCGKNMDAEIKYKKLKRQSTLMFSKFGLDTNMEIDLDSCDSPMSPLTPNTPTISVHDLSEIKKPYEEKLSKEKEKKKILRLDIKSLKTEIETFKEKIANLNFKLEEKNSNIEKIENDFEILKNAYSILDDDHERMLQCFSPYLNMKSENQDLKRTSALLISDIANDTKLIQFSGLMEELKSESILKDLKIKELESQIDTSALTVELTSLKLQLDDVTEKLVIANKERETIRHENRILKEQKGGFGIAAPPPPAPPPPPPPPPSSNPLLNLFKKKRNHGSNAAPPASKENQVLADLMSELQRKLENKVKQERLKKNASPLTSQSTLDSTDSPTKEPFIKLRSNSVPCLPNTETQQLSELAKALKKRNITPIDELSRE